MLLQEDFFQDRELGNFIVLKNLVHILEAKIDICFIPYRDIYFETNASL